MDHISSVELLFRYLPALLYLPSTTPFYGSVSKGAASTIFYTFGMGGQGFELMTSCSKSGRSIKLAIGAVNPFSRCHPVPGIFYTSSDRMFTASSSQGWMADSNPVI